MCFLVKVHKDFLQIKMTEKRRQTSQRLIELKGTEEEIITLGGKMKKIYKHICEQAD